MTSPHVVCGACTQGLTALIAMKLLTYCPAFATAAHGSATYVHLLVEALRLAFADTRHFIGDPAHVQVPVAELLSEVRMRAP
jgi:gamma-glutamyltranspeptidase / glutathione hydrolase